MWNTRDEMLETIQKVDAIYIMGLEGSYLSFLENQMIPTHNALKANES